MKEKINHPVLLKALTITFIYAGGWVLLLMIYGHERLFTFNAGGLLTGGFYLSVTTPLVYILINSREHHAEQTQASRSTMDETLEIRLRQRIAEMEERLRNIKTLKGIIPICAHCKSVRNGSGRWEPVEKYIQARSEAEFSHGLCSECDKELYGDRRMHFQKIAGKYMENDNRA